MVLIVASCFILSALAYPVDLVWASILGNGRGFAVSRNRRSWWKTAVSAWILLTCVASASAATQTVTTLADSGAGSLRAAIAAASSGDTVVFASGLSGTINLLTKLEPGVALTIQGPGASVITLNGAGITASSSPTLQLDSGFTVSVSGLTFAGNTSQSNGGAVVVYGSLVVSNCVFTGNIVTGAGGAILSYGTLSVSGSTFTNNQAQYGAAIDNNGPSGAVSESTFSGNTATTGGTILDYQGNTLTVIGSTFTGNVANAMYNPAAIVSYAGTAPVVQNNLFADAAEECYYGASPNTCPTGSTTGNVILADASTLAPLGYYGGPTQTQIPLPGSSAICVGVNSLNAGIAADQRGFPRTNTTYTGYNGSAPCLDAGAVQTHYTSILFSTQPSNSAVNAAMSPAPAVEVLETNTNVGSTGNTSTVAAIPLTLTLNGTGTLSGTTTVSTSAGTTQASGLVAGAAATFSNLLVSSAGSGDTLSTSLTITPTGSAGVTTLSATSSTFSITPAVAVTVKTSPTGFSFAVDGTIFTTTDTTTWGQGSQHTLTTTSPQVLAATQYVFTGWSDGTTTLTDSVSVPSNATTETYTANFAAAYLLTLSASAGGNVNATVGGSTFTSPGYLASGTTVQLTAVPASGYQFTGWTVTGPAVLGSSTNASTTLTTGAGASTVTANFAQVFSIFVVNGNATVSGITNTGTARTSAGVAAGNTPSIAVDGSGNIWTVNSGGYLAGVSSTGTSLGSVSVAGINAPKALAIDGQGTFWVANGDNTLSEVSSSSAALGQFTIPVSTASTVSIDGSGSLWLTSTGDGTLTEVIGIAAPVVTPLTTAVKNSTLAAKP